MGHGDGRRLVSPGTTDPGKLLLKAGWRWRAQSVVDLYMSPGILSAWCVDGGVLLLLSHSKDKPRKDAMSRPPSCQV
jgi:hypothetical protein